MGEKKSKKILALAEGIGNLHLFWGEQKPVVAFAATGFNFCRVLLFEDLSPDNSHRSGCLLHSQN
jgi:hypothetical protein